MAVAHVTTTPSRKAPAKGKVYETLHDSSQIPVSQIGKMKRFRQSKRLDFTKIIIGELNDVKDMTPIEKMHKAETGITKNELKKLKDQAGLDFDRLARALAVGRATLMNKKGSQKFNVKLSEQIVGLADIYSYGYTVFGDTLKFNDWMFRPNHALGGELPFNIVSSQFGREEIKNLIGRIEYGVFS